MANGNGKKAEPVATEKFDAAMFGETETFDGVLEHQDPMLEQKPEPGFEPGQEQDANTIAEIFQRIALQQDLERVKVGAALMNVFNYAVQVQAKRNDWTHDDFRAFIVAHSAIDQIGKRKIVEENEQRNKDHLKAVETVLAQHPSARRTNLPINEM